MKEFFSRFSLVDFLAYLFPGVVLMIALLFLSYLLPPLDKYVEGLKIDWITGIIGVPVAYFFGIVSSGAVKSLKLEIIFGPKTKDLENPLENPHLSELTEEISYAYEDYFNTPQKWSTNQFYAIRSAVRMHAPSMAALAERQNSLRQMRRNSMLPVLIWGIVGVVVGVTEIMGYNNRCDVILGVIFSVVSLAVSMFIARSLINAHNINRRFEIRDCCLAFIQLHKNGDLGRSDALIGE